MEYIAGGFAAIAVIGAIILIVEIYSFIKGMK